MDPYNEQRLRDEVIYLHSLWHQGPPRDPIPNPKPNLYPHPLCYSIPNRHLYPHPHHPYLYLNHHAHPNRNLHPHPHPNLNPHPAHNPQSYLKPFNPIQFKKEKTRATPRGRRGTNGSKGKPEIDPLVSDIEWPCKEPAERPSSSATGWPALNLPPPPATRVPSAEGQSRFAGTRVQQNALKAAQGFLAANDSDEEDCSDEDDSMDEEGSEEYEFFLKVFTEDSELRGYYEKSYEGGEFSCLVCGGIGQKVGKRYKDCAALVQHSTAIAKTKKKRAHRSFAQVICKILGWDFNRLPTIVSSLGETLSQSLAGSGQSRGNTEVGTEDSNVVNPKSGLENVNIRQLTPKQVSNVNREKELLNFNSPVNSNAGENLMICESTLNMDDANRSEGNVGNGVLSMQDGKAEGVVNGLEHCEENGIGTQTINKQKASVVVNDPNGINGNRR